MSTWANLMNTMDVVPCLLCIAWFIPVIIMDVIIPVSCIEGSYSFEYIEFLTPCRVFNSVL